MYRLTTIAETGERFADFSPYVAAIDAGGTVTFQAGLRGRGTGVFAGSGGSVETLAEGAHRFQSHPDTDGSGTACIYASGGETLVLLKEGRVIPIAERFTRIGPLGPTMNEVGAVAFRADTKEGASGVFLWRDGTIHTIADTTTFAGFQGLPVVTADGRVVFRADLKGGGHGIYANGAPLAQTGDRFRELGSFPCANAAGTVVFDAKLQDGGAGIFRASAGEVACVVDAPFESFRGALVDETGKVFFYATPRGGQLGVYCEGEALISLGDPLGGSTIAEMALNPVSVASGRLAIRLRLADGRQLVVRASALESS